MTVSKRRRNGLTYRTEVERKSMGTDKLNVSDVLDGILSKAGVPELSDKELQEKVRALQVKGEEVTA